MKATLGRLLLLDFGGVAVAITLGLVGQYILKVDFPIVWLYWLPGWTMIGLSGLWAWKK